MGKKTELLYLSEPDLLKAGVMDFPRCVEVLDEMFKLLGQGDYRMGGPNHNSHGIEMDFPEESPFPNMPKHGPDRRFMALVAYLGGRFNVCGEKWYGSNVANPARGLPRSVLMVMLNDPDTCEPIAMMSGNLISAVRTGTVPGVGVKYLAKKNAETCAIIGAGPINKACFQGILAVAKNLKKIYVYDVFEETAKKYADWVKEDFGIEAVVAASTEEAICASEIISVAASKVKPVVIKNEWLKKGSTILLTGASQIDDSYWCDPSLKIVLDNPGMHDASMEEAHATGDAMKAYKGLMSGTMYRLMDEKKIPMPSELPSLGGIALGEEKGRENDDERIVLMTGGIATEDLAWGYEMYQNAKKMGLGQNLLVWDEPHWA